MKLVFYILVWKWPNSLIWLHFVWLQYHSLWYMIEYTGLNTHSHNLVRKLKVNHFSLKRERKKREIKSHSSIKETSVGVSQKKERKVKSSCGRHSQLNSRQSLDSEAEAKVKTWHRPCRVFEREGKEKPYTSIHGKCLIKYLESKKKPWTCSQMPGLLFGREAGEKT